MGGRAALWLALLLLSAGCSGGGSPQKSADRPAAGTAGRTETAAVGTVPASQPPATQTATPTPAPSAGEACFMNRTGRLERPRIVIHKAKRRLELFDGTALVARLPVALGSAPIGPKERQGDGRTPEGVYYACVRNDRSKYHLAIGLSYPGGGDAARGLDEGIIDRAQYDAIMDALNGKKRPPWDTGLGGEIMIHGGGTASDWTAGCIAVEDSDMDYLWELVPNGTEVEILP